MKKNVLILIAMLVLTACSSPSLPAPTASALVVASNVVTQNFPTPTVVTEIPYPPPSSTPYDGPPFPTPSPLPTDQPHPTATPAPLDVSGVWFTKLLNAQQGWVLSDGNLLWTDDTGESWQQMSPPNLGEGVIQNAFFLDSQQAWVFVCDPQPAGDLIKITYTSDGGNTWGTSEAASMQDIEAFSYFAHWCGKPDLGRIFFLNAQQGWILIDHTTSHTHIGEIFQTLDGGKTWQHLGTSSSGEFYFPSGTTGWMFANLYGPNPVYHTVDGGKTWQVVSVEGSDQYDDFFLPVFFDQQVGMMGVALYEEGIGDGVTFFKTQDGGTTWNPIGKLSILPASADLPIDPGDVQIWDEQTWVVSVPRYGVYWTVDGGQTWVENTTETARGIFGLTLGSATTAWGLKCEPNLGGRCLEILVVTEDMGAYWEKVEVQP